MRIRPLARPEPRPRPEDRRRRRDRRAPIWSATIVAASLGWSATAAADAAPAPPPACPAKAFASPSNARVPANLPAIVFTPPKLADDRPPYPIEAFDLQVRETGSQQEAPFTIEPWTKGRYLLRLQQALIANRDYVVGFRDLCPDDRYAPPPDPAHAPRDEHTVFTTGPAVPLPTTLPPVTVGDVVFYDTRDQCRGYWYGVAYLRIPRTPVLLAFESLLSLSVSTLDGRPVAAGGGFDATSLMLDVPVSCDGPHGDLSLWGDTNTIEIAAQIPGAPDATIRTTFTIDCASHPPFDACADAAATAPPPVDAAVLEAAVSDGAPPVPGEIDAATTPPASPGPGDRAGCACRVGSRTVAAPWLLALALAAIGTRRKSLRTRRRRAGAGRAPR